MATFEYIAKQSDGESVSGVMQAESEQAVLRTLGDRGLFPVEIKLEAGHAVSSQVKLKPVTVGMIFQQLADLLRAGVPMLRALETLARSASKPATTDVLTGVKDQVAQGQTLAEAMGEYPGTFKHLHIAMITAGEEAGFLEDVLANLAQFIEKQDDLRSRIRGMLAYPVVLMGVGVLLVTGMLIFVVPNFRDFLGDMDLPLPTRMLFAASDLLTNRLGLLIALLVLAEIALWSFFRSETGRDVWEYLRFKTPWVGRVNRAVCISRFSRILGTMLHNGVPILRALMISKDAAGSDELAEQIEEASQAVRAGEPLAEPLSRAGTFPPDVLEMIAIAEESNQMDRVLIQVADTLEKRTDRQVETVIRLLEPVLMLGLALAVGFVVMGLMYPIFLMMQQLAM